MTDRLHDPGAAVALRRLGEPAPVHPIRVGKAQIYIGVASWTDRTMTARGVFYPSDAKTAESRLRYYSSQFPLVEVDATYYALPTAENAARWAERTPNGFVFDVKAHALMTGHATETARLPRILRDELPPALASAPRVYAKDLPPELRDEVWRIFKNSLEPLTEAGKLGTVFLQYPPWVRPTKRAPDMLARARERLGDLPIAVEFRHPSWLAPRLRERVWALLREHGMTYVVVDAPPGTPTSVPPVAAITNRSLAVIRLHGRRSELWGTHDTPVVEKYRYLYDPSELDEWLDVVLELAEQAERLHIVFNNCYANYGTTNASELARMLQERSA